MKEEFLEHRLALSEELRHYTAIWEMEKAKIIQEEIKSLDLILNNCFN